MLLLYDTPCVWWERWQQGQEVQRAGDAKREVLMEFLQMPEGEILVANVAKLLLYARREKVGMGSIPLVVGAPTE